MKARALTLMSTRSQDQDLVVEAVSKLRPYSGPEEKDQSHKIMPCFGWHPWFSYQLYDDTEDDSKSPPSPIEHYESVLQPKCTDQAFIDTLPNPRSLRRFLQETESRLLSHPHSLIGEVGLDRSFRLPIAWTESEKQQRNEAYTEGSREGRPLSPYHVHLSHQKSILKAQLRLAGKHGRSVSIHSVQGHGAVFEVLQELWKGHERHVPTKRERKRQKADPGSHHTADNSLQPSQTNTSYPPPPLPYPPRICLHSYSGPLDPLHQFLNPTVPAQIYFSFSRVINYPDPQKPNPKVEAVLKDLPENRILVESDYHSAGPETDELLEWIVRKVCEIREWDTKKGVEILARNWKEFVFGNEVNAGSMESNA
ncbi:putative cut9 interacting protein [Phaeomoniella chlamydospora]|uniref:Putative cut9 interacting protein n=1 Tax=Phaeomoniella chlamydospora TaxID=158046 RepID=A0A0G2EL03_PHACM|nr:putative cut9 interacting protein [Phaeomoniella chlamydospora]